MIAPPKSFVKRAVSARLYADELALQSVGGGKHSEEKTSSASETAGGSVVGACII
jgi:hypothetical protein